MAPEKSTTPVSRAALLGLALGVTLAGGVLMVLALTTLGKEVDCSGPDANQCFFETNLAQSFARMQMWIGAAMELLAVGLFLWLRSQARQTPE